MGKTRTVRVSEEAYEKLEKMARADRRSISNMLEVILEDIPDGAGGLQIYVAPELEGLAFDSVLREPDETDDEFERRKALIETINHMGDTAPRRK